MKQDANKKPQKALKKPLKNRNYFARACRFLARLMMFAGILSFVGTAAIMTYRIFNPTATFESSHVTTTVPVSPVTSSTDQAAAVAFATIINIVIIGAAILGVIYLAIKYNEYARNFIDWFARKTKFRIHYIELGIPAFFWTLTILMLVFTFPIATLPLIFTFILNEFLFVVAWLAYGTPIYVY